MRIVLLGCPGAGKGTQSSRLAEKFGLAHISTGDLLRAEIAEKSELGLRVADYLKKGMLVPDQVVMEMVAKKISSSPRGWLLDGFPRNLDQAKGLDKFLKQGGGDIDLVMYLKMDEKDVISRLTSRRSCPGCKEVYNLLSRPPQKDGVCDKCGKALVQREDDLEATVRRRLMVFEDLTRPLVAYYRAEHEFREVDGARGVDDVTRDLCAAIEEASAAR